MSYRGKVVWITGASSGIGEALAIRFAREGARLLLTARNVLRLDGVVSRCLAEGASAAVQLPADLSVTDGLEMLAGKALGIFGRIDVFVSNAGISQRCSVTGTDADTFRKVFDVDFNAPVTLTGRILPAMLASGGGQLVAVSSIAGLFGTKGRCVYCSAKAALMRYFETIDAEYHNSGIDVTVVVPGRVRTDISVHALEAGGKEHGRMDPGQAGGISPEKAAEKIFRAVSRRRSEVLVGGMELLMAYFKRFLPGVCRAISRKTKAI